MARSLAGTYEELEQALAGRLGEAVLETVQHHGQLIVRVAAQDRPDALRALKDLGLTYYCFCCGVDRPDQARFEILDQVYSLEGRLRVTLKCEVPREEPRVPTATTVYAGANWHERETWELMGIVFVGHPKLARLLLPDWFEGFPLRKDFVLQSRVEKPWPGEFFEG